MKRSNPWLDESSMSSATIVSAPIPRCHCGGRWIITHGRTGYDLSDAEKEARPFQAMAAAMVEHLDTGCRAECVRCGRIVMRANESDLLEAIAGPEIEELRRKMRVP